MIGAVKRRAFISLTVAGSIGTIASRSAVLRAAATIPAPATRTILIAGGGFGTAFSAGSLCWFEEGTTDSRPKDLTTVQGLGFIKGRGAKVYYVGRVDGKAVERVMEPETIS